MPSKGPEAVRWGGKALRRRAVWGESKGTSGRHFLCNDWVDLAGQWQERPLQQLKFMDSTPKTLLKGVALAGACYCRLYDSRLSPPLEDEVEKEFGVWGL